MASDLQHVVFGAGVLGQEIARKLAAAGASVHLASRSGTPRAEGVQAFTADLTDPGSAAAAAKRADVIYFCAAPPYHEWGRSFHLLQEGAIAAARRTGAVLVAAEKLYGWRRRRVAANVTASGEDSQRRNAGADEPSFIPGSRRRRNSCRVRSRLRLLRPRRANVRVG